MHTMCHQQTVTGAKLKSLVAVVQRLLIRSSIPKSMRLTYKLSFTKNTEF